MTMNKKLFIDLLNDELVTALGCTEPIAIAFCAAKARDLLNEFPDRAEVYASNNIIKNVKSVTVPKSDGLKGVDAACVLGIAGGNSLLELEVLNNVTGEDVKTANKLLKSGFCKTYSLKTAAALNIIVKVFKGENCAEVELKDGHTNIVRTVLNGNVLYENNTAREEKKYDFTLDDVYEFADTIELSEIQSLIGRQLEYNVAIAKEGLNGNYGSMVGKTLLQSYPDSVAIRARAMAAAGTDARMNGCAMPVVINSGSGNQGITLSVPIYVYAGEYGKSREELIRATLLSNLVGIYIKKGIGKLSAFCGAVSASCGVAAGLVYLMGGNFLQVGEAITNTAGNVSGIVCDGAKSSCAAKIASSVDAGIMAFYMAMKDNVFSGGDGIVDNDIEGTIDNISRLGRDGMRETDDEIISIMLKNIGEKDE